MENQNSNSDYENNIISELDLLLQVDKLKKGWEDIILSDDAKIMVDSSGEIIEKIDHLNILYKQYKKGLIKKQLLIDSINIIKKHAVYSSNRSQMLVIKCDVIIGAIP